MTEPLPCPWCGQRPTVAPQNPKEDGNAWGKVACLNQECPAYGVSVGDGVDVCDERGSDAYKEAAILRWNTRS